jgi:hypothetical protein
MLSFTAACFTNLIHCVALKWLYVINCTDKTFLFLNAFMVGGLLLNCVKGEGEVAYCISNLFL